jgi:hypothetical protein
MEIIRMCKLSSLGLTKQYRATSNLYRFYCGNSFKRGRKSIKSFTIVSCEEACEDLTNMSRHSSQQNHVYHTFLDTVAMAAFPH